MSLPVPTSVVHSRSKYLSRESLPPLGFRSCAQCRQPSTQCSACSNCLSVAYCSVTCQKAHWKQHKSQCKDRLIYQIPLDMYGAIIHTPYYPPGSSLELELKKLPDDPFTHMTTQQQITLLDQEIGVTTPKNIVGLYTTGFSPFTVIYRIVKQRGVILVHDSGRLDPISILNFADEAYYGELKQWTIYYIQPDLSNGFPPHKVKELEAYRQQLLDKFRGVDLIEQCQRIGIVKMLSNQLNTNPAAVNSNTNAPGTGYSFAFGIDRDGNELDLSAIHSGEEDAPVIYLSPLYFRGVKLHRYNQYWSSQRYLPVRAHFDGIGFIHLTPLKYTIEETKLIAEKRMKDGIGADWWSALGIMGLGEATMRESPARIYKEYEKVWMHERYPESPHHKYEYTMANCYQLAAPAEQQPATQAKPAAAGPAPSQPKPAAAAPASSGSSGSIPEPPALIEVDANNVVFLS